MLPPDPHDTSRFEPFVIHTTAYKVVHGHSVTADILYPKALEKLPQLPKQRPIVVRYHGGGFITGASLYPHFWPKWMLEFVQKHNAIVVSPDHRLLPEASFQDLVDDTKDFWTWLHSSSFPAYLEQQTNGTITADLDHLIVCGDSAGGYLSLQAGLDNPTQIRAVLAAYPTPLNIFESLKAQAIENEAKTGEKTVISADPLLTRLPAMLAAIQHGVFQDLMAPGHASYYPLERIERGEKFPPGGLYVWHGKDDTVVTVDGSQKLEQVVKAADPALKFTLEIQPGEHGFDGESKLNDPWIAGIIKDVEDAWLS